MEAVVFIAKCAPCAIPLPGRNSAGFEKRECTLSLTEHLCLFMGVRGEEFSDKVADFADIHEAFEQKANDFQSRRIVQGAASKMDR